MLSLFSFANAPASCRIARPMDLWEDNFPTVTDLGLYRNDRLGKRYEADATCNYRRGNFFYVFRSGSACWGRGIRWQK
jgi:hypothetical protein